MSTTIMSADGHLTIPEPIRRSLGLTAGTRLHLEVGPGRALVVRPEADESEKPSTKLFGMLRHLARERPVSVEEMNAAIADGAAARFRAATRE